jgi:hypothetical protein
VSAASSYNHIVGGSPNIMDYGYRNGSQNVKGWQFGYEHTLFKNGIVGLKFNLLKDKMTKESCNNYTADLTYKF